MASITVRSVPDEVHRALRVRGGQHGRDGLDIFQARRTSRKTWMPTCVGMTVEERPALGVPRRNNAGTSLRCNQPKRSGQHRALRVLAAQHGRDGLDIFQAHFAAARVERRGCRPASA
jgi:hypothetical protein